MLEAHATWYKANEGFGHVRSYSQWITENDFDESEEFSLKDLEIIDKPSAAKRLWDNAPATFKTKNVDRITRKPKGKDSTYVVGKRGMVRFKEDTGQTLSHPDRHICFVNGGSFDEIRAEGFKLKSGAKEKIVVDSTYTGDGRRLLLGSSATPMIVSLAPFPEYRACDFNYDSDNQKATNFHVGHPVKPI